ncbi:MAG: DNA recombination protein RmuC [Bacteriovoracales bacterium]|nr:DNA recombination protein RmuC [Bacteriovoracales bacterium]
MEGPVFMLASLALLFFLATLILIGLLFHRKSRPRDEELSTVMEKLYGGLKVFEDALVAKQTRSLEGLGEKTQKTFSEVLERMGRIDEAQKKIEALSSDVISLQDILTDKKSRGTFGEVRLEQILAGVFGEKNDALYRLQYTLESRKTADAVLFLPPPIGNLCVDSKFPLENYRRMYDSTLPETEREAARKEFKQNVKKHIQDIATKYIVSQETSDQAVMFVPAEAVFAEIHAHHGDLIVFSQKHRVWISSPTTFWALLSNIQISLKDSERGRHARTIQEELAKLSLDFERYQKRWDQLVLHLETVGKDAKEISISSGKISSRFDKIKAVEFDGGL